MKNILLAVLFTLPFALFAQKYLDKNEYFFTLSNRLDILVIENDTLKTATMGLNFRAGSVTEDEPFDGTTFLYEKILVDRIKFYFSQNPEIYAADSAAFQIKSETSLEQMFIRINFPPAYLKNILQASYESVSAPITASEVASAVQISNAEYEKTTRDTFQNLTLKVEEVLWAENFKRKTAVSEWSDSLAALAPQRLEKMRSEYFCSRNTSLIIKGPYKAKPVHELVKNIFSPWEKCKINPFTRFPAPNYKLLLNSVQLIDENNETQQPFFIVAFQGPNTFEDRKGNFSALILSSLLAHPQSALYKYFSDSCKLRSFRLENDMAKFISQMSFIITPHENFLAEGYECFREVILHRVDSPFINEKEIALAKELISAAHEKKISSSVAHVSLAAKFWSSLSLDHYSTFRDSIQAIGVDDVKKFVQKYIVERNYVAGLSIDQEGRKNSQIDSVFTPTGEDITHYKFHFLANTARFASPADDSLLTSLIQFLKINPAMKIKVNGVTHKDELLHLNDNEMRSWVKSLNHFIMNPPSLIETKKFRLDVYRSLTIMKKLVEAGIDITRLFGTGHIDRSTTGGPEKQIAYCTIMIN